MNVYNFLPKGLKSPLVHIAYGLQVLDGLLERIASAFQSLDLVFEAFDWGYIIVFSFSEQRMSSKKCLVGTPVNIHGSASASLPSWGDLPSLSSGGEGLAPRLPAS